MHEGYEKKYQQIIADKGYDKLFVRYDVRERTLRGEVEECRQISELLEQENNNLQRELSQLKSAASTSKALIPVTDEGFSFLEVEDANLRDELETLKRAGPSTSSHGRARAPRGRARATRIPVEEHRTQSTLENQSFQLMAKNQALA